MESPLAPSASLLEVYLRSLRAEGITLAGEPRWSGVAWVLPLEAVGQPDAALAALAHAPGCGRAELLPFGYGSRLAFDAPIGEAAVHLHLRRPRYRCAGCGVTIMSPLPSDAFVERSSRNLRPYTMRLAQALLARWTLGTPFTALAAWAGVSTKTASAIVTREARSRVRAARHAQPLPTLIGIDEMYLWRRPFTLVYDLSRHGDASLLRIFEGRAGDPELGIDADGVESIDRKASTERLARQLRSLAIQYTWRNARAPVVVVDGWRWFEEAVTRSFQLAARLTRRLDGSHGERRASIRARFVLDHFHLTQGLTRHITRASETLEQRYARLLRAAQSLRNHGRARTDPRDIARLTAFDPDALRSPATLLLRLQEAQAKALRNLPEAHAAARDLLALCFSDAAIELDWQSFVREAMQRLTHWSLAVASIDASPGSRLEDESFVLAIPDRRLIGRNAPTRATLTSALLDTSMVRVARVDEERFGTLPEAIRSELHARVERLRRAGDMVLDLRRGEDKRRAREFASVQRAAAAAGVSDALTLTVPSNGPVESLNGHIRRRVERRLSSVTTFRHVRTMLLLAFGARAHRPRPPVTPLLEVHEPAPTLCPSCGASALATRAAEVTWLALDVPIGDGPTRYRVVTPAWRCARCDARPTLHRSRPAATPALETYLSAQLSHGPRQNLAALVRRTGAPRSMLERLRAQPRPSVTPVTATRVVALYAKRASRTDRSRFGVHLVDLRHGARDSSALLEPLPLDAGVMTLDALLARVEELYLAQAAEGRLHIVASSGALGLGVTTALRDRDPAERRWRDVVEPYSAVAFVRRGLDALSTSWRSAVTPRVIKKRRRDASRASMPLSDAERAARMQRAADLLRLEVPRRALEPGQDLELALRDALDQTRFGPDTWAGLAPLDVDEIVAIWRYLLLLARALRPLSGEPRDAWRERLGAAYTTPEPQPRDQRLRASLRPSKDEFVMLARHLLAGVPDASAGDPEPNTRVGRYHAALATRLGLTPIEAA